MNNKILSIHYLRGIAGLMVVFFHFRGYLNDVYSQKDLGLILFKSGAFGVDLFFMISGFIIALSTRNVTSKAIFAVRRFFRIYPAFILVFIFGILTVYSSEPTINIIKGMFFIHRDYSTTSPEFGLNVLGPAWTLTYEIYFYSLFVLAMCFTHRYRTILSSIFLLAPIVTLQLYYNGQLSLNSSAAANVSPDNIAFGLLRFMSSPIITEFVVGMIFYEIFSRFRFTIKNEVAVFALFVCSGFFITCYFSNSLFGFGLNKFGLMSAVLLFGFLTYDKSIGFKENKLLIFLGDISFSIYISHYVFISMMNLYKPDFYMQITGWGRFFMMTTITISVGTLVHFYVEKPFILIGKRIEKSISNLRTSQAVTV